jgi:hypothetical protein
LEKIKHGIKTLAACWGICGIDDTSTGSLKIFSKISRPILIKVGINHPWVKGILNCSNKGPGPLQSGDNHKNAKMGLDYSQEPLRQKS